MVFESFFNHFGPLRVLPKHRVKDPLFKVRMKLERVPNFLKEFAAFAKVAGLPEALKQGLEVAMVCTQQVEGSHGGLL
jgi:hypothetical protein